MNIFSAKSIGLYSLAIGSAIGFFHVVTSYGEANIKAPISVTGNYLITAQNLPGCLQGKTLLLRLQQSGIYLNASLSIVDRSETTMTKDIRPTLSGQLRNRQLSLSGLLPPEICLQPSQLRIAGSLVQPLSSSITTVKSTANSIAAIQGQLWLTNRSVSETLPVTNSVAFTGTFQPSIEPKSTQSH
jgi:hypothetical protein